MFKGIFKYSLILNFIIWGFTNLLCSNELIVLENEKKTAKNLKKEVEINVSADLRIGLSRHNRSLFNKTMKDKTRLKGTLKAFRNLDVKLESFDGYGGVRKELRYFIDQLEKHYSPIHRLRNRVREGVEAWLTFKEDNSSQISLENNKKEEVFFIEEIPLLKENEAEEKFKKD